MVALIIAKRARASLSLALLGALLLACGGDSSGGSGITSGAPDPVIPGPNDPLPSTSGAIVTQELRGEGRDEPVVVSQVFRRGDARDSVAAAVDGRILATQVDVKRRHDDGSIRHAILSFVAPELPTTYDIVPVGRATARGEGSAIRDLLRTDFDVQVRLQTGQGMFTVSARDLLERQGNDAPRWLRGPHVEEVLLTDQARASNGSAHPQLSVQLQVRAFAGRPGARVSVVVENTFAEARGAVTYDVSVVTGRRGDETAYTRREINHYNSARWRQVVTWGDAPAETESTYSLAYLAATGAVPNYDRRIEISEAHLRSTESGWRAASAPMQSGSITGDFPRTGGRMDIGPLPTWAVRYLLSMDARPRAATIGNGEQAGSFSIHLRSRSTGRVTTIDDHPTASPWIPAAERWSDPDDLLPAPVGSMASPYQPDLAHQPSLALVPYLITGDFFFLEEMYFWAGYCLLRQNWDRREGDAGLLIGDQTRGQAWGLRALVDAAYMAPDDHPEKDYFTEKVHNNIAHYAQALRGSPGDPFGYLGRISTDPNRGGRPDRNMASDVGHYTMPWQGDFLVWALDRAARLGFPEAAVPRDRMLSYTIGRFTSGPAFDPFDGAAYRLAVSDTSGNEFRDWGTVWRKSFANRSGGARRPFNPDGYGYPIIAMAALATGIDAGVHGAEAAYDFIFRNMDRGDLTTKPNFAIVPLR